LTALRIKTPKWSLPLLKPGYRYYGAKGGRASGKSHERAEALIELMIINPNLRWVCIREIQKSIKYSSKLLLETKLRDMGLSNLFEITLTEIRRIGHSGLIIFQGMQDHTADSIKSLEGFDGCWVEEAQSLSAHSLELLDPTIRKDGAQLWFTWNPRHKGDAIEVLFNDNARALSVHVNYLNNPFISQDMIELANESKRKDPEKYNHIWLGGFNEKSEAQIFNGKYSIQEFEPLPGWDGPYFGSDFGFSQDPTTAVKCWINDNQLMVERDCGQVGLELDKTAGFINAQLGVNNSVIRADSARPESISYLKRYGMPNMIGVKKWPGSVEDGVEHMKSYEKIIIHPRCQGTIYEFDNYSYKMNKAGDVLSLIKDADNHYMDAIRYALQPLIKQQNIIFEAL
tara:strand:- start:11185 stop:12381 length:1197 start_codon:yes stop_codon:yes gene_type:complete